MKSAESGTVTIIVVIVGIVAVTAGGRSSRRIGYLRIVRDDRLRTARVVGQRAKQVAVLIRFVNDGIGHQRGAIRGGRGGRLRGIWGRLLHGFFARGRVYVIVIGEICSRTGC